MKRCGLEAGIAAAYERTHRFDVADDFAYKALRPYCGTDTLIHVNDMGGHAVVLQLFDEVIAAQGSSSTARRGTELRLHNL